MRGNGEIEGKGRERKGEVGKEEGRERLRKSGKV